MVMGILLYKELLLIGGVPRIFIVKLTKGLYHGHIKSFTKAARSYE